jgi:hypothetical protein
VPLCRVGPHPELHLPAGRGLEDLGTDGVVDFRDITTNTYDGHSNLVVQLRETDSNADGTPESVVTITTTYRVGGH